VGSDTVHWTPILDRLLDGEDLGEETARRVMTEFMAGNAEPAELAGFLVALRAKGESPGEVAGFVRAMLQAATPLEVPAGLADRLVDTCGTGGDAAGTFNISTVAAVVTAAAGVPVAKHGNRAASSRCGSADLLEAWGVELELTGGDVVRCLEEVGIAFLYARAFHPAMRFVAPVRQQLGIRTVFNVLGPLSNPAGAPHQVVGVAERRLGPVVAEALGHLGKRRALVFRGHDGLDELTTSGDSDVWELRDGEVRSFTLDPRDVGVALAPVGSLHGGGVSENRTIGDAVLAGTEQGPHTEVVVLNAGAALYTAGAVDDLAQGVSRARETLASGAAAELLQRWVACSRDLAGERSGG
jgi:anthranilate phosphoribosyltransferase